MVAREGDGFSAWASPDVLHPDALTRRIPLVGPGAPLSSVGPVTAAGAYLDGGDRLHLAWSAGDAAYYARCPVAKLADKSAWQGPLGGPAPEGVAPDLASPACVVAAGARAVVAGVRRGGIAVFRFDGTWQETFAAQDSRAPALARDSGRGLRLAYAGPEGVICHASPDGIRWLPREVALPGRVSAGPSLAVASGDCPVVAAVADGQGMVAGRSESGWARAVLQPSPDASAGAPWLSLDRHGSAWCFWQARGQVWGARWLGTALAPAVPVCRSGPLFAAEQQAPDIAPDLGVALVEGESVRAARIPVPGLTVGDDRPARFLDLLELASLAGVAREGMVPASSGTMPPPAKGDLQPGGLAPAGKDGRDLRAWFSVEEEGRPVGCTAEWKGSRWQAPQKLQLASPRPWLQPPSGALAALCDPDEPAAARRWKMAAEHAGPAPALLTSGDGLSWSFFSELPAGRPLSLLRDALAPAEQRWKVYAASGPNGSLALSSSPDQEHWYPMAAPCPDATAGDAAFWVEDGMVLGLLDGGRRLVAGRDGSRLVNAAELPALAGDGKGRLFAPPFQWAGRRRLFLAAPDAWRWVEAPAGRWVALKAADDRQPGVCTTVPISLAAPQDRRLLVDAGGGSIRVEVLDSASQPVPGYAADVRANGWARVSWGHGRQLDQLKVPAMRLRFTLTRGARLYGFRFS